jgi:hypothetical protein
MVEAAQPWISERLRELGIRALGPVEQVRARPSLVLAVPTDRGRLFFKANEPAHRREAARAVFLGARRPDLVPPPLAVDPATGWMLMADAGTPLRELVEREHDVGRWLEVLPLYAALQAELVPEANALVAIGTPDLPLAGLAARFEALLADLERLDAVEGAHPDDLRRLRGEVPGVAARAGQLAGFGIPETIQHDDLNDSAVYADGGRYRVIDWGDACVSHPFFSLSVALEGVIAWGPDDVEGSVDLGPFRDAYLAGFAHLASLDDLRAASAIALRLGWICRAVNGHAYGDATEQTWTRLRMAFDGHP